MSMKNSQNKTDLKELKNEKQNLIEGSKVTKNDSEKNWVTAMIKDMDNQIDRLED